MQIKIAGGNLAQANGNSITVSQGQGTVTMGAGQDSCGVSAPARPTAGNLVTFEGMPTGSIINP